MSGPLDDRGVKRMIFIVALVLMAAPLVVLYVCERAAEKGRGPMADPARMVVLDGVVVSAPPAPPASAIPGPLFTDPGDDESCAAESGLVRGLLDGTLARERYHAEMAVLAAGTMSPPVRPPGDPGRQ